MDEQGGKYRMRPSQLNCFLRKKKKVETILYFYFSKIPFLLLIIYFKKGLNLTTGHILFARLQRANNVTAYKEIQNTVI